MLKHYMLIQLHIQLEPVASSVSMFDCDIYELLYFDNLLISYPLLLITFGMPSMVVDDIESFIKLQDDLSQRSLHDWL